MLVNHRNQAAPPLEGNPAIFPFVFVVTISCHACFASTHTLCTRPSANHQLKLLLVIHFYTFFALIFLGYFQQLPQEHQNKSTHPPASVLVPTKKEYSHGDRLYTEGISGNCKQQKEKLKMRCDPSRMVLATLTTTHQFTTLSLAKEAG
jgi:hypothetical protein